MDTPLNSWELLKQPSHTYEYKGTHISILGVSKSITWPRAVAASVANGIDVDDAVRCSLAHHLNFQALNTKFTS